MTTKQHDENKAVIKIGGHSAAYTARPQFRRTINLAATNSAAPFHFAFFMIVFNRKFLSQRGRAFYFVFKEELK